MAELQKSAELSTHTKRTREWFSRKALGSSLALAQLKRVRWGVRAVLVLGIAASVTANVLHARPNLISQIISAWPPLAFLVTVEVISKVPVFRRSLAIVRLIATACIAGIAAWVSYWHMTAVAGRYGESYGSAHLLPFSVDGMIVIASVGLVELATQIRAHTREGQPTSDLRVDTPPTPPAEPIVITPAASTPTAPPQEPAPASVRKLPAKVAAPPKVSTHPTLTIAGVVPDNPREAAEALAQDKTGLEIWRLWGSPEKPARRTVEWWVSEARKNAVPSPNGGRAVGAR